MISKGKRLRRCRIEMPSERLTERLCEQIIRDARMNLCIRYGLALISFVAGILLIIFDVNREGMIWKMKIGPNVIEYLGSYVGVVVFFAGVAIVLSTRFDFKSK